VRLLSFVGICVSAVLSSATFTRGQQLVQTSGDPSSTSKRSVTVADTIEMTRVAGDSHYNVAYPDPRPPLAYFSPNGETFLVVLRKGNLERNTNDYSMLLFKTDEAFHSPKPKVLVKMSSSSDQDAIRQVQWIDNATIAFIGENVDQISQVHTLNLKTGLLEKRTSHSTNVLKYQISIDTTDILFSAEEPKTASHGSDDPKRGVVITNEMLQDVITGNIGVQLPGNSVFSQKRGLKEVRLPEKDLPRKEDKDARKPPIEVKLEQDLNTPQKLYVFDPKTKQESLLLDLNPQFAELRIAKPQIIAWKGTTGKEAHCALYLPSDYVPGKRYPLVIQTHYFNTDVFLIDGPWGSGYAAQALVGKGIIVAQVGELLELGEEESEKVLATRDEAPYAMADYEGLINELDARGLIDREKVGIFGFSRTVYYVTYTLTHSTYPFAAAILENGVDESYLQALALREVEQECERIYGGPPYGETLASWTVSSPGFNLAKVKTPVRIMDHGYAGAIEQWEWFSGLRLLHKPVEMVLLSNPTMGEHLLKKPWERMISQQGTVDWFCYWLKNYEDPDPAKTSQYQRWRVLRQQYLAGLSKNIPTDLTRK
jgi:hypothetical protein